MALRKEPENTTNERGRKMTIKNGESYEGVTVGELEEQTQAMISCADLDSDGSGRLNFRALSCYYRIAAGTNLNCKDAKLLRDADGQWYVKGCKATRGRKNTGGGIDPETRRKINEGRVYKSLIRAKRICELYAQHKDVKIVADELGVSLDLVRTRLKEAGVYTSAKPRGEFSIKEQVFKYMRKNPGAKSKEVSQATGLKRTSCAEYIKQYNNSLVLVSRRGDNEL